LEEPPHASLDGSLGEDEQATCALVGIEYESLEQLQVHMHDFSSSTWRRKLDVLEGANGFFEREKSVTHSNPAALDMAGVMLEGGEEAAATSTKVVRPFVYHHMGATIANDLHREHHTVSIAPAAGSW
jgi:hypothetical protein